MQWLQNSINLKVNSKTDNELFSIRGLLGQPTALEKGDLVRLGFDQTGESLMKTMWCSGTNERNKKEGEFPLGSLYILPTLSKPSQDILVKNKTRLYNPRF